MKVKIRKLHTGEYLIPADEQSQILFLHICKDRMIFKHSDTLDRIKYLTKLHNEFLELID